MRTIKAMTRDGRTIYPKLHYTADVLNAIANALDLGDDFALDQLVDVCKEWPADPRTQEALHGMAQSALEAVEREMENA